MRHARSLLAAASVLALATPTLTARADTTAQSLPFSQNWTNTGLITTNDDWSGVPGITGYRGDGLASGTGVDPQTVVAEGIDPMALPPGVVDVNANQTSPNTYTTGGVAEFHITDPVVALQGSGTARAPFLLITISTTGRSGINVSYNLRDIDGSTDNAVQPVALQYRVGTSGNFTNVAAGYLADASTGPSLATLVTAVSATLPAAADNQAVVQVRIITTDAVGSDEWIGIDDISIGYCGDASVAGSEQCDPGADVSGDCCTASCQFVSAGNACRYAVSECDVTEYCGGSSGDCPADGSEPTSTPCGLGGGKGGPSCDAPDHCSGGVGASAYCIDAVLPSGTTCRAAVDVCDAAETCNGVSAACPPDGVRPSTAVCRASAGPCDPIERCDGVSTTCGSDRLLAASVVCRPAVGPCDVEDHCSGVAAICPTDLVQPVGTICRASAGTCDPAETCTGTAVCPGDRTLADGSSCSDGLTCNGDELCMAGSCAAGTAPSCDDANACTADMCAEPGGCAHAAIAGCCNVDGDCADDGDVCTSERCTGAGGMCQHLPIADCCTVDADCGGGGTCVSVTCNLTTNRCQSAPIMGCCTSDADCDDAVACTADHCDTATGACTNATVPSCCTGDGDCDDANDCTADTCDRSGGGMTGTCAMAPITGCCMGDGDCMDGDGDACTAPGCNTTTHRCGETAIDCDDMDACTADACEADGSCSHTAISCDDGDDCTADACSAGACEHTPIDPCGEMTDAGMMGEDAGMMGEDAGMMVGMDAALPDAGFTNDAASLRTDVPVDAGSLANVDAGIGDNDAGDLTLDDTSGCHCSAATPDRSPRGLFVTLGLLGLALVRKRRRR